jgi:hypothetical protein
MAGVGKEVFVYIPEFREAELMYDIYTNIVKDLGELQNVLTVYKEA